MTGVFEAGLLRLLGRYVAVLAVLAALTLFCGILALIYGQSLISSPGDLGAPIAPPSPEAVEKRLAEGPPGPVKSAPRGPKAPKLSAYQQNLVDFAIQVDPQKGPTYFTAYDLALRTADRCGRGARGAFSAGLRDAYAKLSDKAKSLGYQAAVAAYCSLWRNSAYDRDRAASEQARARRQGRRVREVSIGVVVGSLGFLVTLSLPLALIAIAGNTRALTGLAEAIARSDKTSGPGPGPGAAAAIVLLATALMAGPALAQAPPGLQAPPTAAPPVMTEDQILRDKARKLREAALAARRKHVGKAYVFQPSWTTTTSYGALRGQTRTVKAATWFYRAPYTVWISKPKTRFRPVRLTRFSVQGLDSVPCYSSTYTQRQKRGANECYFYRVDLGGGLIAYLEAGRLVPAAARSHPSRSRYRTSATSGFTGINALAFVSTTPRGAILAGMPDELGRLAQAEKARKAADRAARLARLERERKARAARRKLEAERQSKLYAERARQREEERKARAARQRAEWQALARKREAERKAARERQAQERKAQAAAARRARLAKRFPETWLDGILAGRVETGWNTAAVREAWGRPRRTLRVPPSDEMWVYRGKHVIFSDGKVRKVAEVSQAAGSTPALENPQIPGVPIRPESAVPKRTAPQPGGSR